MDFSVRGTPTPRVDRPWSGRPPSAKPQHSRNPITGEETAVRTQSRTEVNIPQSRNSQKPDCVPDLDLKYLKDVDNYIYKPVEVADYPLRSPSESARTDVSWGTAVSSARSYRQTPRQNPVTNGRSSRPGGVPGLTLQAEERQPQRKPATPKPRQPSAWDKAPVPEDLPPPSHRHKQLYKEYEDEMKESYQKKGHLDFTEEEIARAVEEVKQQHPHLDVDTEDIIEKSWTKRQKAASQLLKKMDAEELLEYNKKQKLIETVMVDQLSRAVISDPEQNMRSQAMSASRRPRGSNRSLHDSKVRTAGTNTENLLSKRVRFGARVVTRNGHDAIRELTGFFFSVDNTMTIYEFRQFGKSAKALPFINRGRYCHLRGPREGEPYTLPDITSGLNIMIRSTGQHSLPETLKKIPEVTFRVTDVDEEEKRELLLNGVPEKEREEIYARLHIPNKQEYTEKMVLKSVQSNVQKKIRKRAIRTITGLGRFYRKTDSSGRGILYRFELEKGLFDYHIDLPPDTLDALFEILDIDERGELDYSIYMTAVIGCMVEARKALVRKAFQKIDTGKKGYLTLSDIHKFFNSTFRSARDRKDSGEAGPLQAFLDAVLPNPRQEEVSYVEFEEYYEGLSIQLEDDEDFVSILRNTWTL